MEICSIDTGCNVYRRDLNLNTRHQQKIRRLGCYSHLKLLETQNLDATLLSTGHQVAVERLYEHNRLHRSPFAADAVQDHLSLLGHVADHRRDGS